MVKLHRFILCVTVPSLLVLAPLGSLAHGHERGEAQATVGGAKVSISYGQPMLQGRDPLKLIQPGQLWRIGADDPTTLESDTDLNFSGTRVPKGKYILLARYLEPGKWSLVFSTKSIHDYEPSAKVAEVPLQFEHGVDVVEAVEIKLTGSGGHGKIEIAWGTMRLVGDFSSAK